jgi:hypothetical protein
VQGARCQERRNAAPPSARKESPTFSNPWGLLAITSTSGTGPRTFVTAGRPHLGRRTRRPCGAALLIEPAYTTKASSQSSRRCGLKTTKQTTNGSLWKFCYYPARRASATGQERGARAVYMKCHRIIESSTPTTRANGLFSPGPIAPPSGKRVLRANPSPQRTRRSRKQHWRWFSGATRPSEVFSVPEQMGGVLGSERARACQS